MKKILIILTVLILLAPEMLYAQELTLPEAPPLTLQVPEPLTLNPGDIVPDGQILFAFTTPQYGTILKIGVGYKLWVKNYPLRNRLDELWELKLKTVKEGYAICTESKQTLAEDRQYAYQLFFEERDAASKAETQNTLRTVLYVSGGVVVGAAIGIIIGAVIVK